MKNMKTKIRRRCQCGCGKITSPGRKYIHGHNTRDKIPWNKGKRFSEETKLKMSLAHQNMSKKTRKKMSLAKQNISDETRKKISDARKKQFSPMLGKHHSKETKKKLSLINIGKKLSKETREKMSLVQLEHWQNPEYQKMQYEAQAIKPNKPELKLEKVLNKLYPNEYKYVGDFQFWLGGKNPDFMNINGQKKLIELYGDYWHRNANPQDRIDHFKKYGFNTLVIWEHELKKSRLNLRRKLKDFHRR